MINKLTYLINENNRKKNWFKIASRLPVNKERKLKN